MNVVESEYGSDSLEEDIKALERVEEKVTESDKVYTFGDIRDELSDTAAEEIIHYGSKAIDDSNETMIIGEDTFEYTKHAIKHTHRKGQKSAALRTGILAGGVCGLGISGYLGIKNGDPFYLGTGLISAYISKKSLDEITSILGARNIESAAEEHLDLAHSNQETYEVKMMNKDEIEDYLEQNDVEWFSSKFKDRNNDDAVDVGALGPEEVEERFG